LALEGATVSGLISLTPQQFTLFQKFIYRQTGIWTQDGKIALLSNRIRRRLRERNLESFDDYYGLLTGGSIPGELEAFIDAITTNETHFFRMAAHFDWFAGPFLDELIARASAGKRERTLRVWSAACSTGEEPYTLAICLAEQASRLGDWTLELVGTDICESALATARTATYRPRSLEHVSADRLSKHFVAAPGGDTWTVRPTVTRLCQFHRHNLLEPMPGRKFDCIFIRNVLIYFDSGSKAIALGHLVDALQPGGYLVVGTTDGAHDHLEGVERCSTFLYKKP
jgi:chemotaxis protein methyltransferase CheR